jgi:hypothetical protein
VKGRGNGKWLERMTEKALRFMQRDGQVPLKLMGGSVGESTIDALSIVESFRIVTEAP